jgi:hypothetical protein
MAYNLIVAYDLIQPGQNYEAVQDRIMSLGRWYKFQYSLFYVRTALTPEEAHAHVRAAMDVKDKLLVVEATRGVVSHYPLPDIEAINLEWFAAPIANAA